jgi:hypothetical protein
MKKQMILLFTSIMLVFNSFGQIEDFESETIFLHTNETTFVTGETLLYKIYCMNANSKELSKISKIAYIELIDLDGILINRSKIALKNGIGANEIFINTSCLSGNYKLIAYTSWMLNNQKSKYFETEISIINPFISIKNIVKTTEVTSESKQYVTNNTKKEDIELKTSKKTYSKREKITLDVIQKSERFIDGNFSISVRKVDHLKFNQKITSQQHIDNITDKFINTNNVNFLPELRGELLSGKITSKNESKTNSDKHISLSILGEPFDQKIVKTNANGEFHFILEEDIKKSDIILQIIENNVNDFNISINKPSSADYKNTASKNNFTISNENIDEIEKRLVACQIVNSYRLKDSLLKGLMPFDPFYKNNAKEYILDDFKRFPTFKETITEIVPAVYFKQNGEDYSLHIRDYITGGQSFGAALVLIDGLFLQDVNELFNYNTNNIYKICVINSAFSYGSKIFSGVISIVTFNKAYNGKSSNVLPLQIERCEFDKPFQNINYDSEFDYSRIPDYRYQLAWDTNFLINKDSNVYHFFASDLDGFYEISLEGFSKSGEPLSINEYFEVK